MKSTLVLLIALLSLSISHAYAAEYVCQLTLAAPVVSPSMGTYGYISYYSSPAPNCSGATKEILVCSKGATNKLCGVYAQYSEAALMSLYETLRNSEATQQQIVSYWDGCIGGGNCTGGVLLYPNP
jgi:hypothetical protein